MKAYISHGTWTSDTAPEPELRAILGDAIADQILAARLDPTPPRVLSCTFAPGPLAWGQDDADGEGRPRTPARARKRNRAQRRAGRRGA